jgi:hypothetical protein
MLAPKIVGPHLMLTPRFAVDAGGAFAVSRSLFFVDEAGGLDPTLLRFFCGVTPPFATGTSMPTPRSSGKATTG